MDKNMMYIIGGIVLFVIIFIIVIIRVIKGSKTKKYKKIIDDLEYQKNQIDTSPVGPELAKIEAYLNNQKLEVLYADWQERLSDIKENKIPKITDMLIEAEFSLSKMDYKSTMYKIAKLEMEIYKVRTKSEFLLDEIKEITKSEERNRAVITKLKASYRELLEKFIKSKSEFGEYAPLVELQFENIAARFEDFEGIMERNEYTEVGTIVNAIEEMLSHISVVLEELPAIALLVSKILPKKISDATRIYERMCSRGYPLGYLNVEFNVEEANKKIEDVIERAKVLDLEDSLFDLKILNEYFDNLFTDFEKEKIVKAEYEDACKSFLKKLANTNELACDMLSRMDELKEMYDLKEEDVNAVSEVREELDSLNGDYKVLESHTKNNVFAFSKLTEELDGLASRLNDTEEKLDIVIEVIGSMHDDEVRARQQLDEVKDLLRSSKKQIGEYNLPILPKNYYVELREANEAMGEIVKELNKKPLSVETLNTRVDTARDLALKLSTKTTEMIKTAMFAEMAIVYGNRYRSNFDELDKNLIYSEALFNKGDYMKSLELTINSLNNIEPGIYDKLLNFYKEKI